MHSCDGWSHTFNAQVRPLNSSTIHMTRNESCCSCSSLWPGEYECICISINELPWSQFHNPHRRALWIRVDRIHQVQYIQLNRFRAICIRMISFQHGSCDYIKSAITTNRIHNVRRVRLYIQILVNMILLNATGDFVVCIVRTDKVMPIKAFFVKAFRLATWTYYISSCHYYLFPSRRAVHTLTFALDLSIILCKQDMKHSTVEYGHQLRQYFVEKLNATAKLYRNNG